MTMICLNCVYYNPKKCSTNGYCYRVRSCSCCGSIINRTLVSDDDSCKLFTSRDRVAAVAKSIKNGYEETEPAKVRY